MVTLEYEVAIRAAMPFLPTPSALASAAISDFHASYPPPVSLQLAARAAIGNVVKKSGTARRESSVTGHLCNGKTAQGKRRHAKVTPASRPVSRHDFIPMPGNGPGVRPHNQRDYLTFLPAITVPSLACPEFAVARTFGTSFFGFLASLPPLFFSLDIRVVLSCGFPPGKARGVAAAGAAFGRAQTGRALRGG